MNNLQHFNILYECLNAIGNSLDLKTMLNNFIRIFSKKTGAISAVVYEINYSEDIIDFKDIVN